MGIIKGYTMINVSGEYGYSFVVKANEEDAIDFAIEHDAFENEVDAEYATTSEVTDYDFKFFKKSIVE